MTDQINVTFECQKCGGTILELPDNHDDNSIVKCKSCGFEFGTYGQVKEKAKEAAVGEIRQKFKDTFKGLKGWKVT